MAPLAPINRAFNLVPKRAESRQSEQLRETFVDSGVAAALESVDHQVLYGRRGTGKTHAFRYIEGVAQGTGNVAVYADLRTVGSPDGLLLGDAVGITERASRLLVDLLGQIHDALLAVALDDETLMADATFVKRLDALAASAATVRVVGELELSREHAQAESNEDGASAGLTLSSSPSLEITGSGSTTRSDSSTRREVRRGQEAIGLNFSDVSRALREVASSLSSKRVWILLDEWISVPQGVQPFLAEFLVRCVLPLQQFTIKIAAIEQQTNFRATLADGTEIGIELGADVAANVNLDEFMVFEQNEDKARDFFRGLLFKHLTLGVDEENRVAGLNRETDLVRQGFTDKRAFDELVRAAEGVPRDAINIAAAAALRAGERQVSVQDVRVAARSWFQNDKEAALRSREDAQRLLTWIIDNVIRGKRARGFMVNQRTSGHRLLVSLFEARVIHLVRHGYSAQDEPGERYDVYVIDYGAYVDLIQTKNEPRGVLPIGDPELGAYVDVPTQDLRALRRAILNLDEFEADAPLF